MSHFPLTFEEDTALLLCKDGLLFIRERGNKGYHHFTYDVSNLADTVLFKRCAFESGVVLRDILLLVKGNKKLYPLLGNWCDLFIEEAFSAPVGVMTEIKQLVVCKDVEEVDGILFEKDCLRWSGIDDSEDGECSYGIDFCNTSDLVDLPVIIKRDITSYKKDTTVTTSYPMLGVLLFSLFEELSFYGSPKNRDRISEELSKQVEEIKRNIDKGIFDNE